MQRQLSCGKFPDLETMRNRTIAQACRVKNGRAPSSPPWPTSNVLALTLLYFRYTVHQFGQRGADLVSGAVGLSGSRIEQLLLLPATVFGFLA